MHTMVAEGAKIQTPRLCCSQSFVYNTLSCDFYDPRFAFTLIMEDVSVEIDANVCTLRHRAGEM